MRFKNKKRIVISRKLSRVVVFFLILTAAAGAYFLFLKFSAKAAWYNSSWNYRKSFTVSHSGGAVTNYQIKLTVYKSSGTDSGGSVYLGTNVQDDFDDLRFTTSDGTTLLDYWIESYTSGTSAVVWVECNSIGTSATTFYIYYGNSSASAYSNGVNTFIFFDDFNGTEIDTNKWTFINGALGNGKYSVASGVLNATSSPFRIRAYASSSTSEAYRLKWYCNNATFYGVDSNLWYTPGGAMAIFGKTSNSDLFYLYDTAQTGYDVSNCPASSSIVEIKKSSTQISAWINDVQQGSTYGNTLTTSGTNSIYLGNGDTASYNSTDNHWDWVLLRNFASDGTEPSFGSWGSGEQYQMPIVLTLTNVVALSGTSSTVKGNITSIGGGAPTVRGFKYGLTETDTWTSTESGSFSAGEFSANLAGLSPGTTYYIRAYATNSYGTSYGSYVPFVTNPAWYNSSWNYRKPFNINRVSGDIANYQVRLNVYKGTGTDMPEAYKVVFNITSTGGYQYSDISSVSDYVIQSGDYIEYDVMWTASGDRIAFDYTCSDSTTLRDSDALDQNNMDMHPMQNISSYALNQWYSRRAALPSTHVGKTIQYFDIVTSSTVISSPTGYIKNIRITDSAGTIRKQILIGNETAVTTASHISNAASLTSFTHQSPKVYLGTNVQDDFDDIRFTGMNGSTLLDYWIESYTSGTSAVVWVEFDTITTVNTTFYVYYGNSSATAQYATPLLAGEATFVFFDNFNTGTIDAGKWTQSAGSGGDIISASTNELRSYQDGSSPTKTIQAITALTGDFAVGYKAKTHSIGTNNNLILGIMDADQADGTGFWPFFTTSSFNLYKRTTSTWTLLQGIVGSYALDTYNTYETILSGSSLSSYKDSVQIGATQTVTLGANRYLILPRVWNETTTDTGDQYFDDIRVRKYVSTEPTWGTWGTEIQYSAPTVTMGNISVLSSTTATVRGTIVNINADTPTVRGFKWGLTQTDTWTSTESGSLTVGDFSAGLSGLTPGTTYYVRAYATNSVGTSYGSYVSFTTNNKWSEENSSGWSYRKSMSLSRSSGAVTNYQMKLNVYNNWLGSGWSYRKKITIAGTSAGAQTNYQMKLTVYKSSGTDSGSSVYLGTNIQDDFDDLRFTTSNGTTLLDYWIESYTSGTSAVVWVEFDSIPASPSTAIFYLYYGNSGAMNVSSGANTFIKFDDFEWGTNGNFLPTSGGSVTWYDRSYYRRVFISTENEYTGVASNSRSAKFPGFSTESSVGTAYTAGSGYAIVSRFYKETAVPGTIFGHGNGTWKVDVRMNVSEQITAYPSSTTLATPTADAWHSLEVRNINFSAHTYDIWLDGSSIKTSAAMSNETWGANEVLWSNYNAGDGKDLWIDNFIIRNFASTEPTWGTWGSEEIGNTSCDGHCQSDFDDLRFTNANGTQLDYWIESYTSGTSAVVWVEFDSIGTTATTFYMYYGNSSASSASNGDNTFIFFDDFSTAFNSPVKWTGYTTGASVSSGILTYVGANQFITGNLFSSTHNAAVRTYAKLGTAWRNAVGMGNSGLSQYVSFFEWPDGSGASCVWSYDGTSSCTNSNWTRDAYKTFEILVIGGTNARYFENGVEVTGSPKTTRPINDNLSAMVYGCNTVDPATYGSGVVNVDWILVRNYESTEPVFGAFGEEDAIGTMNMEGIQMEGVDIQGF